MVKNNNSSKRIIKYVLFLMMIIFSGFGKCSYATPVTTELEPTSSNNVYNYHGVDSFFFKLILSKIQLTYISICYNCKRKQMIPKIIHYCWFGDKPLGELEQKCVASWSKVLPDYEIKRWGNECLDQFDNKYLRQAVAAKKWAFVSDYVRLFALWNEGGIYFDTDEEVVRPLDEFLDHDFVIGSQRCGSAKGISPALIGTVPHHEIIGHIMDVYNKMEFVKPDGTYDQTPNPVFFANVLRDFYGIKDTYIKKGKVKIV